MPRFRLRSLLLFVTAIAVLTAQYPYVRFVGTEVGPIWKSDPVTGATYQADYGWVQGIYVPTFRMTLVFLAEVAVGLAWWTVAKRNTCAKQRDARPRERSQR